MWYKDSKEHEDHNVLPSVVFPGHMHWFQALIAKLK